MPPDSHPQGQGWERGSAVCLQAVTPRVGAGPAGGEESGAGENLRLLVTPGRCQVLIGWCWRPLASTRVPAAGEGAQAEGVSHSFPHLLPPHPRTLGGQSS